MTKIMIVASTGIPREKIDALKTLVPNVEFVVPDDNRDSIYAHLDGINALIGCPRYLFSDELIGKAKSTLRWVHVGGAGCEEFIIPSLVDSDIILTNGKIIQGPSVADHACALLLALTRNIHHILRGNTKGMPRPIELRKKTALIIGLGGVGMLIAERVKALGMRVLGLNPDYVPMHSIFDEIYPPEKLSEALLLADCVIIACSYNTSTDKLFGAAEFKRMKKNAYFINVARGKIVDTGALTEALGAGEICAAGLDVTDPEPLPDNHPLLSMKNVIITPHTAGPSDKNRLRSFDLIKNNIIRFADNKPLINTVNKRLGY